jgi:outer membrane lipoprotein-sorting protein
MRKFLSIILFFTTLAAFAQTPVSVLDKAVSVLKSSGTVTASYSVVAKAGTGAGTIAMSGVKYRILAHGMKSWYDGKTQWSYSTATGEVDITNPTASDLEMTNPYAAAQSFKTNFNMWKARTQLPGSYTIKLVPKKKSNIKQILLYISTKSYQIQKAKFEMSDNSVYLIAISNYKTHVNLPASTFTFDKSFVPKGAQVVDLR